MQQQGLGLELLDARVPGDEFTVSSMPEQIMPSRMCLT